ncbi:MAG: hypothetical protein HQ536_01400 [Parcubacteria group bacterium]|nr:hypothetical protein [Parcubacteria group bacterium]
MNFEKPAEPNAEKKEEQIAVPEDIAKLIEERNELQGKIDEINESVKAHKVVSFNYQEMQGWEKRIKEIDGLVREN